MKHLKSYAKQNLKVLKTLSSIKDDSGKFYVSIGEAEYGSLYRGGVEKMEYGDIERLRKLYPNLNVTERRYWSTSMSEYHYSIAIKMPRKRYFFIDCIIMKIPDDYYLVKIDWNGESFFKCDQFDGLMRLLRDKL